MALTAHSKLRQYLAAYGLKAATLCALAAAFVTPSAAQAPSLAMLDSLSKGSWEVRFRSGGEPAKICVRTGRELIQIRHKSANCNRFVVEDSPSQVTVQYTCRDNGYGRTNIRKETSGLVQVEGQGIAGAVPFEFKAEARRVGPC